jgi:phthiocerol/phenolphthiocerol synthesis type-I polyketide synthase E
MTSPQPPPRHARPTLAGPYVPPDNHLQKAVAEVWQEFLGVERVGIHDRFLELGGDSLVATQIVARLRERLAPRLPISALFETPTVAEIAAGLPRFGAAEERGDDRSQEREEDREETIL